MLDRLPLRGVEAGDELGDSLGALCLACRPTRLGGRVAAAPSSFGGVAELCRGASPLGGCCGVGRARRSRGWS